MMQAERKREQVVVIWDCVDPFLPPNKNKGFFGVECRYSALLNGNSDSLNGHQKGYKSYKDRRKIGKIHRLDEW